MIGAGAFEASLNAIEKILKRLELLDERQLSPNKVLKAGDFRGKSFREIYEFSIREFAYDFRLTDQAILLFTKSGADIHNGSLNYSYLEAPVSVMTYLEFVALENQIDPEDTEAQELIEFWGEGLRSEYEIYVSNTAHKEGFTPLRYDCKAKDYRPNVHPASHLHFGFMNHVRVGTRRIMNPLAFTLFVIRQRYPEFWIKLVAWGDGPLLCSNVRSALSFVDSAYWCDDDERELFFH